MNGSGSTATDHGRQISCRRARQTTDGFTATTRVWSAIRRGPHSLQSAKLDAEIAKLDAEFTGQSADGTVHVTSTTSGRQVFTQRPDGRLSLRPIPSYAAAALTESRWAKPKPLKDRRDSPDRSSKYLGQFAG